MNAVEQIAAKVSAQSTKSLKEMAHALATDTRDGVDLVLSAVLDALMARLPEAEFISLCDAL